MGRAPVVWDRETTNADKLARLAIKTNANLILKVTNLNISISLAERRIGKRNTCRDRRQRSQGNGIDNHPGSTLL